MLDEEASTPTYGKFVIEPFERGFGTTVGNSLRRILLSSLEGAAVTCVKIKGADHEFTTLPGVVEDVTSIILNIKSLVVRSTADEPKIMRVAARGKEGQTVEVRADQIEADPAVEVINQDQLLATLTDDVEFEIEMTVGRGRSYATAQDHSPDQSEQIIGEIPVDSVYSPVTRVRYRVEDTRVGQRTNYDRLVMEIWTKGTVSPSMALVEAAKILRKHLNALVQLFELGSGLALEGEEQARGEAVAATDSSSEQKLATPLSSLDLSVRAGNCLDSAEIVTVGDLVGWTESRLLKLRSFGRTSLREVKRKLADIGLSLRRDAEDSSGDASDLSGGSSTAAAPGAAQVPIIPGMPGISPMPGETGPIGAPTPDPGGQSPATSPQLPSPAGELPSPPLADSRPGDEVSLTGGDADESRTNEGVQSL
jgi:DNA-directed RNA polymerase subunit alpha